MSESETTNGDGFPYFWLGAEAESIPTPWRAVWLARPTMMGASDGRFYQLNDHGLWEHADG